MLISTATTIFSISTSAITCAHELPKDAKITDIPVGSEFDFGNRPFHKIRRNGDSHIACTETFEMVRMSDPEVWASSLMSFGLKSYEDWSEACNVCGTFSGAAPKSVGKLKYKGTAAGGDRTVEGPDYKVRPRVYGVRSIESTYSVYFETENHDQVFMQCMPSEGRLNLSSHNVRDLLEELLDRGIKCTPPAKQRAPVRVIDNPDEVNSEGQN